MEQVLVTGGSGFVAAHCIIQLLNRGYRVRTTLRNPARENDVRTMLANGGITALDNLSFAVADLAADHGWDAAMTDCAYVLHVASPIGLKQSKDENDFIRPAVEGTLRVLRAAKDAGVRRVVMTSSFGAVSYGYEDRVRTFTETDWTDLTAKNLQPYIKSKTLAEHAAWDFVHDHNGLELSVINPVGIFGPTLNSDLSSAFEVIEKLLDGNMKSAPNINFAVVDVRDVADLHIRAMTSPQAVGQRFIAAGDGDPITLFEMGRILKTVMGDKARGVPARVIPDWIVRLSGLVNAKARSIAPLVGKTRYAANTKAKTLLGWQPGHARDAINAAGESLLKLNIEF